jgi:hypothetical protein
MHTCNAYSSQQKTESGSEITVSEFLESSTLLNKKYTKETPHQANQLTESVANIPIHATKSERQL